jgi:hypothetical protein
LGDAKEMDELDLKGAEHLLGIAWHHAKTNFKGGAFDYKSGDRTEPGKGRGTPFE